MAWKGRKPLTTEERAQRVVRTGGVLTEEEQDHALQLIRSGVLISDAIRELKRSADTFYNTLAVDPEFAKELDLAKLGLAERVEESLVKRALGGDYGNVIIQTRYKRAMENGKYARNPDGSPKWEEVGMTVSRFPCDTQAASLWLRAYRPDKFDRATRLEVASQADQSSPEDTQSLLNERWAALAKHPTNGQALTQEASAN